MKVFGVMMTLLLVFSFAATFTVSSTVSAGTQKWTKISIPGTDDMQLAPGTDVGAIAVSPDGEILFAAVYNASGYINQWQLYKSVDDGYTWKVCGNFRTVALAAADNSSIVAIKTSPDWENDGRIYVATQNNSYSSKDRGTTFASMHATAYAPTIASMDVSLDSNGDATVVIGTSVPFGTTSDVYIYGEGGWLPQLVGNHLGGIADPLQHLRVRAVAFSPNYGEDGTVLAVVTGETAGTSFTYLTAESDIDVNNWGSYIQDAPFTNKWTGAIVATKASIAFPEDYNSQASVFVGLEDATTNPTDDAGDAFRVDLVMGTMGTSNVNDLNIRGVDTGTNVNSIAVSGPSSSAFIIVGLTSVAQAGPMSAWKAQAHYSENGGESWLPCYKPPSGMYVATCAPTIVMAPDFADSGIAYCGNGFISTTEPTAFSGFYVSTTKGTTWNGRGLLDHHIDQIEDVVPSPKYDTDKTLFMVTNDSTIAFSPLTVKNFGLLWETKDGGSHWELILGLTLMIPLPGVSIDKVEIPATYPDEPSIFVNGPTIPIPTYGPSALIARSTDEGNLFASTLNAPYSAGVPLKIDAWVVIDQKTLIVANSSNLWKTTDMGAHWIKSGSVSTTNDIGPTEKVIDMQIFNDTTVLVGTDQGKAYICDNWETDFSFTQVGSTNFGANHDVIVSFDTNYGDNGIVYAGVWDNGVGPLYTNEGIWRVAANSGDEWEQIVEDIAVESIRCDGNGILWALAWDYDLGLDVPYRCVNPTDLIDDIQWEKVTNGLSTHIGLWADLEVAPTQTYVFALGGNTSQTELWTYIDTLIKPTLISPADSATAAGTILQGTSNALVSLRWEDMPKAQLYDYQVAYDDGFGSIATDGVTGAPASANLEGTQVTVSLFLGEKYYWRVRVSSNSSVYSQWSETWSFTTPLGPASAKPVCMSPTEGLTGVSLTPTLQWSSSVDATGFELVVAANCDWSNAVVNLTGSSALDAATTAYPITQALPQHTNYCWKVRAINANTATNSPWSDTGTFTTLVIPVVEEAGTPVWVWVVIALSAILLVGVVVLIVRTRRPV